MQTGRTRRSESSARSSKKLEVSSFLDFQGAWYALFEALNGLEQFGVVRSSSEFLGAPTRSSSELFGVAWERVSKRFRNLDFI